jgi:hypothetical protein
MRKFFIFFFSLCIYLTDATALQHRDQEYNLSATPKEYNPSHRPIPTIGASPFFEKNIFFIQENIQITIDENGTSGIYINEYNVSLNEASQIPFLLASIDETVFDVEIDGEKIEGVLVEESTFYNNATYKNFAHYGITEENSQFILYNGRKIGELDSYARDYLVYTKYLEKGEHKVVIAYRAYPEVQEGQWMDSLIYKYSFIPAHFYKDAHKLSVDIVSHDTKRTFFLDMKAFAQSFPVTFESIDRDGFRIVLNPITSETSKKLIDTGASSIAFYIGIAFLLLHLLLLYKYSFMRRFWMLLLVSMVAGYIILKTNFYAIEAIDKSLGEFAHGSHGYIGLLWLSYPYVAGIYLFAALLFSLLFKKIQK